MLSISLQFSLRNIDKTKEQFLTDFFLYQTFKRGIEIGVIYEQLNQIR